MQPASLFADWRYGFRQLRRNPGFASTAVLTLTLGIGANVALFSVVRNVLLKPLPYREPQRLVRVWMDNRRLQMREDWASYLNYQDYRRLGASFESMAAFTEPTLNLTGDGEPERVRGANAEAALFDVLGVKPIQGRLFTTGEEAPGKGNVVVIGWSLWQRRFGGLNVEGKLLDFDGRRFTVIGVMPLGFAFPDKKSEFWAPLVVSERAKRRSGYWLQIVGRLKPGITVAQAQAEMDVVGKQVEQQYPDENTGYGIFVNSLMNHVAGNVRTPLLILLGAVGFVLLIACVNVAGLFLTRTEARSREIMVRSAMGASRTSIIRQLVMEAGALAAVAGATGIAAAYGGVRALLWLAPKDLPRLDEIALDGWALVFGLGLATLTAFLFGLWPAWRLSRVEIQDALRGSGRGMAGAHGAARARGALVIVELAAQHGVASDQVTGGCFCCRFGDLVEAAARLEAHHPDVIFAEAVGSCTDVVSTTLRPLLRDYADRFRLAPFTVLVDPMSTEALLADEDMAFLWKNQVDEADMVWFTKSDLVFGHSGDMRQLSARTGEGVDEWLEEVLGEGAPVGAKALEVDYDRYARAEAALAWLNCRAIVKPQTACSPAMLVGPLLEGMDAALSHAGARIVHLKVMDQCETGYVKAAQCGNEQEPGVEGVLDASPAAEHDVLVNLRAVSDPEVLRKIVEKIFAELKAAVEWRLFQCFRPSPPVPWVSRPR